MTTKNQSYLRFLLILGILFSFSFTASAQLAKHSLLFGGYIDSDMAKPASNTTWDVSLDLQAGYMLGKRLALGLNIPLTHSDGDIFRFENDASFSRIGLLPFAQLYLGDMDKAAVWFLCLESGFHFVQSTFPEIGVVPISFRKRTSTDWVIGGGFGVNAFVSEKTDVSVALKGQYVDKLSGDLFINYPFLSLNVGVQVFVDPRRKKQNE